MMKETRSYCVAGHTFCVSAYAEERELMTNYEPFALNRGSDFRNPVFALSIESGELPFYSEELRQEEEGQTIICGKTPDGSPVFEFQWNGVSAGLLVCSEDYKEGRLIATGRQKKAAIDNALMIIYALATADKKTALFHAAAVSHEGKGYMFLGPSGTGKSTHARLWIQYISGTELVNDDNPVVRIFDDGEIVVFGSPWSGKTPCYRNISYPLEGIVMLSQAPYNRIFRISGIRAYSALRQSISGKRWDKRIADGLHETENELTKRIPIWHLECLPDKEAAEICFNSTFASENGGLKG